jgi:hypothetical protein
MQTAEVKLEKYSKQELLDLTGNGFVLKGTAIGVSVPAAGANKATVSTEPTLNWLGVLLPVSTVIMGVAAGSLGFALTFNWGISHSFAICSFSIAI